jgi:hypothetical protein
MKKEEKDAKIISDKIAEIEHYCGLKLTPCDYFKGIKKIRGRKYFSVINIDCRYSSRDLHTLERLVRTNIISGVAPNGCNRVAIYL